MIWEMELEQKMDVILIWEFEMEQKNRLSNTDRCVICGEYVPEGRMVCIKCENEINNPSTKKTKRYIDAEELKHILNSSKYYGKKAGRDFADMIAECSSVYLPIDKT